MAEISNVSDKLGDLNIESDVSPAKLTQEKGDEATSVSGKCEDQVVDESLVVQEPADEENYWSFSLFETYKMAMKFYKENEGKRTFTIEYEDKVYLAALTKQVSSGPYANQKNLPEVGYLDVFGRDRRKMWNSFADMSSNDARRKFIETLDKSVSVFAPFMAAHQKEKEEHERLEKIRLEAEEAERVKEQLRIQAEEEEKKKIELQKQEEEKVKLEQEKQKQQLMTALNTQTQAQFQQYAAQQHPGNPEKQAQLIKLLQEQHYQQYIMLCMQQQQQQQQLQQQQQQQTGESSTTAPQAELEENKPNKQQEQQQASDEDESEESAEVQIAEASVWTRPQLAEFKSQIKRDPESVLVIGRGEVVTIRVPTHEEGSYVFWEFASDSYDLGFGVMFEWNDGTQTDENYISVQHGETTDEETDEDDDDINDPERRIGGRSSSYPAVDEIVPIYRRDCHVEVHAGSHRYPGRGIYLLKFDNSYSLWRSKTLYYRVYNTR